MSSLLQEAIKIIIIFMEIANTLRPKGDFSFLFTFVGFYFLSVWGLYIFNNFKCIFQSQFMIHSYCFSVELSYLVCIARSLI